MRSKWTSRKWIATIVGVVFTITSTAGFEMPVEEVAMVDAIILFYVLIEGIIDAINKKPQ